MRDNGGVVFELSRPSEVDRLLQDNPTLMRLRELEALEKVAATAKLNVVLGDKGLMDKIANVM